LNHQIKPRAFACVAKCSAKVAAGIWGQRTASVPYAKYQEGCPGFHTPVRYKTDWQVAREAISSYDSFYLVCKAQNGELYRKKETYLRQTATLEAPVDQHHCIQALYTVLGPLPYVVSWCMNSASHAQ